MSVVATVKVYDGIVLGAESMTQLTSIVNGAPQWIKSYENATKIFHVGPPVGPANFPVGLLTFGIGNIGRRSIESFVHEFNKTDRFEQTTVADFAQRFFAFMQPYYQGAFGGLPQNQRPIMGFVIAGYSEGQHLASEWEFQLPLSERPTPVRGQDDVGAAWRGVTGPFYRVLFGLDPQLELMLTQAGATAAEIQRLKSVIPKLTTQVAFDGMPLKDAIGFCKFVIQTTIGWCTYATGSATCGGPIRLATITPGAGFEWVTRPKHYLEGEKHDQ